MSNYKLKKEFRIPKSAIPKPNVKLDQALMTKIDLSFKQLEQDTKDNVQIKQLITNGLLQKISELNRLPEKKLNKKEKYILVESGKLKEKQKVCDKINKKKHIKKKIYTQKVMQVDKQKVIQADKPKEENIDEGNEVPKKKKKKCINKLPVDCLEYIKKIKQVRAVV